MKFCEISLKDKRLFDRYLKEDPQLASEMTFTNLFMWRYFYRFRYTEIHGYLCIVAVPEEGEPYAFMPIGRGDGEAFSQAIAALKEYFQKNQWKMQLKRVPEESLYRFQGLVPENGMTLDRDNSDYVYLAEDLIHLAGKRFDGKRNHINKFKKLYTYEYVPLRSEHLGDCHRIMDEWCAERECKDHKGLYCEKLANKELLNHFEELGCKGALIMVDDRFCAFTVGEMLNGDTAVIHIEKASSKVNGLYTYINQQFCMHEWRNALYINREQDLGAEGLRKAKLSYNPVKMISKYTVVFA